MKFYLSSFRLGSQPERFATQFSTNKKVGVIVNAMDDVAADIRVMKLEAEYNWLRELGLQPEELDLRSFFHNSDELASKLETLGGIWVRGGNSFTLRKAFQLSGLDNWILSNLGLKDFVYGGYSAGVVILQKDLHGIELVDPTDLNVAGYPDEVEWEGLGLLDYNVAVHFRSDHPESHLVENLVNRWLEEGKIFRTLKDGEVIITDKTINEYH